MIVLTNLSSQKAFYGNSIAQSPVTKKTVKSKIKYVIDTNNKRQGGYDVTTPLRVRISGTTVARRTKFGHNVHHTKAVVISGLNLGLDPWEALRTLKWGPSKECVSESLSCKNCCVIRAIFSTKV